jgi:hypothetical protein
MTASKISVDLTARTFEIEVPDERIDEVLNRIEKLFAQNRSEGGRREERAGGSRATQNDDYGSSGDAVAEKPAPRKRGKGGTPQGYKLVDLGLNAAQRQDIQKFFAEKNPQEQNGQVAVLGVKLKELLGRSEFSFDEIHSALKIVNNPTPRNLRAVFGNIKRDGKADYNDGKVVINSYTEDFVNFHMKAAKEGKEKTK